VIRLLQDRFLGVYSPSPGTIYPRLARLEAEGLVSHEVIKGKKVYTLTDKGRAELERRMDELAELEEEISASAQEFAREVQQDVRQTVRSLREELTQAARTMRDQGGTASKDAWKETADRQKQEWQRHREHWREQSQAWKEEWRSTWEEAWKTATGSRHDVARLKLECALHSFVEDVRAAARDARLEDEDLADAQRLLDEARDRIRVEIFGRSRRRPEGPKG
jgi:DNA-binding PadR family transcriptional regulator